MSLRTIQPSHQAEALERLAELTRQGLPAHTYYVADQVTILADGFGAHRWTDALGRSLTLKDGTEMPVVVMAIEALEPTA